MDQRIVTKLNLGIKMQLLDIKYIKIDENR